jgi:AcrR family transcriptional regulator
MSKRVRDPLAPRTGPSPTRQDSREIVEAIVVAVIDLADPSASMDAIAERAGVGVASVYRYFPNRAAIYAEISKRLHRAFLDELRAVLAEPHTDLRSAVRAVTRLAVHGSGVSAKLRLALNVMVPASWSLDSAQQAFEAAIDQLIVWLKGRALARPDELEARVFVAFAMVRGTIHFAMSFPALAPSADGLVDYLTDATVAVIAPPPST